MPTFQASSNGSSLEPGVYLARITNAELKRSKANNLMIQVTMKVFGQHGPAEVFDNFVFTERSFWKIEGFWYATGHNFNEGDALSVEPQDCFGLSCWVKTSLEPGSKNPDVKFPRIERYMREEDTPYKGIDPDYAPSVHQQSTQPRQQPAYNPAQGGGYQQGGNYSQQGAPTRQNGGWSQQGSSYYPPNGRQQAQQSSYNPEMADDDIPF